MFHYLYYKLYLASLKSSLKDIPRFMTAVSFGGLIAVNIFVIIGFLAKLNLLPFYTNEHQSGLSVIICIILAALYFHNNRVASILKKYSKESKGKRIQGNIIVALYVVLSFLSIFAVGFFNAGKL
ncbi:hypothetical protein [Aequorivita viscosa]|uniref:Uncharacterized protein n=1 Tax=Aequorivita viscosa TaxID=797419 RepID=A0A1M6PMX1_9FLAO|nr:hypothetical protein [Aequorivita viscosa]SDX56533.1 hypothetical protein SAMN05216556_1487 [Aequorivita viscosa]SHK09263.1 hypothetical protein SAMN04487908_1535 [Aequorivita viscosa]